MHVNYLTCDSCEERMALTDPHVLIDPGDVGDGHEALTFHMACFRKHCRFITDEHERTCLEVANGSYGNSPLIITLGYYPSPT